jgi:hypothetical protein
MIDTTPKSYPLRCRWCGDRLMIDVPFDVTAQAGYAECIRGHSTPYRYDGVTVVAGERRRESPRSLPLETPARRPQAGS